jgi:hypothetical protein
LKTRQILHWFGFFVQRPVPNRTGPVYRSNRPVYRWEPFELRVLVWILNSTGFFRFLFQPVQFTGTRRRRFGTSGREKKPWSWSKKCLGGRWWRVACGRVHGTLSSLSTVRSPHMVACKFDSPSVDSIELTDVCIIPISDYASQICRADRPWGALIRSPVNLIPPVDSVELTYVRIIPISNCASQVCTAYILGKY